MKTKYQVRVGGSVVFESDNVLIAERYRHGTPGGVVIVAKGADPFTLWTRELKPVAWRGRARHLCGDCGSHAVEGSLPVWVMPNRDDGPASGSYRESTDWEADYAYVFCRSCDADFPHIQTRYYQIS